MKFTATMRGHVEIRAESSAETSVLTPEDYERFLDALNDALYLMNADDVTIGGSLSRGEIEVSFSVEGETLAEAHQSAISVLFTANASATATMARRLVNAEALAPHWTGSEVTELVGA